MDVRSDAPFPPRLIHHRVCSAALRGYRVLRTHPEWTQATSEPAARPPAPTPASPSSLVLGAPFCPTQRRTVASHPKKAAASPPLYSRDLRRPGALQQLAEFLSSFLQKLHRKLQTPLVLQRPGLRQRPPARRPQLLPRRPAFVLLPHPALQPGRNSRIPLRRWGAAGAGPFPGPSRLCPRVPDRKSHV